MDIETLDKLIHPAAIDPGLPPAWYAELLAGWGDAWHQDADGSWLEPEPED